MKKLSIIFLSLLCSICAMAQSLSDIGKIVVGVKILPDATKTTKNNQEFIQRKLTALASNAGFTSYGYNAFFLTPSVVTNDIQIAEGGMKNIYVVSGEIYLTIQEGNAGTVFASTSYSFKGSGTSEEAAIKNGLQKVSYGSLKPFFDDAKKNILEYYSAMQDKIFAKAEMLAENKEYDAAIACLLTMPEELFEIYQKAYTKACEIYQERDKLIAQQLAAEIKELNDEILVKARSFLANHDAAGTLKVLWDYKMAGTGQDDEYNRILAAAEQRITDEEEAALAKAKQEYDERRFKEERAYQDQKLREERAYQDQKLREERAYADSRREYEDNLKDRRQAYADEVNFRNRQLDLENKLADYDRENKREITEAVKSVALEYCRTLK